MDLSIAGRMLYHLSYGGSTLEVCKKIRFSIRYWPPSNIRHPKRASSDVGLSTFNRPSVECRVFDIQSALLRMSGFRHSIGRLSNVGYSTSKARFFGCRAFDILSAVRQMSNIRHPKCVYRISNIRHPKRVRSNVEFLIFDRRKM